MAKPGTAGVAASANNAGASAEQGVENFDVSSSFADSSGGGIIATKTEGMYSASKSVNAKGEHARIVGWLMGCQQIETKYKENNNGEKMCLVVETTKPTIAVATGKPYVLPADSKLLVPLGDALANDGWDEKATNEDWCFLVEMYPTHQTDTAKGNKFWHWKVTVLDAKKRSELAGASVEGMVKAITDKKAAAALPAASSAS